MGVITYEGRDDFRLNAVTQNRGLALALSPRLKSPITVGANPTTNHHFTLRQKCPLQARWNPFTKGDGDYHPPWLTSPQRASQTGMATGGDKVNSPPAPTRSIQEETANPGEGVIVLEPRRGTQGSVSVAPQNHFGDRRIHRRP